MNTVPTIAITDLTDDKVAASMLSAIFRKRMIDSGVNDAELSNRIKAHVAAGGWGKTPGFENDDVQYLESALSQQVLSWPIFVLGLRLLGCGEITLIVK